MVFIGVHILAVVRVLDLVVTRFSINSHELEFLGSIALGRPRYQLVFFGIRPPSINIPEKAFENFELDVRNELDIPNI
jgi:hypothetical protein